MLGLQSIRWSGIIPWLRRAWSLLWFILFSAVYFLCLWHFTDVSAVNKYYGALLQILSGVFILIAIHKNLIIFRSKTEWQLVIEWLNDFPNQPTPTINVEISATLNGDIASFNVVHRPPEDRLQAIEFNILRIEENQKIEFQKIKSEINNLEKQLNININNNSSKMVEFDTNLKTAMAGDIQSPIFGVLLAIIGTIISLLSKT